MQEELNWIKDVGIAAATLFVLGRIMLKLVQASIEYYQGEREDTKERNGHFKLLLEINDKIAGQIELTRQAIEHSGQITSQQTEAIRLSGTALSTMRHDLQKGFVDANSNLSEQLTPLLALLNQITREVAAVHTRLNADSTASSIELANTIQHLLNDLTDNLDTLQNAVARAFASQMLPVMTRLDELTELVRTVQQELHQVLEDGKSDPTAKAVSGKDGVTVSQP